jgi:predicted metal-dependent enzyme (double-stranded beta helix superfamily)
MLVDSFEQLVQLADAALRDTGNLQVLVPFPHTLQISLDALVVFSETSYTRTLLRSSNTIDLYLICWRAGQSSRLHDHPPLGCVMLVMSGLLCEDQYANVTETPSYLATKRLTAGESSYNAGSEVLHRIHALQDSVSLHLYQRGYVPRYYHELVPDLS